MSQLFTSGCQSIGTSALASVLPMNIHGQRPLGLSPEFCSNTQVGWVMGQSTHHFLFRSELHLLAVAVLLLSSVPNKIE